MVQNCAVKYILFNCMHWCSEEKFCWQTRMILLQETQPQEVLLWEQESAWKIVLTKNLPNFYEKVCRDCEITLKINVYLSYDNIKILTHELSTGQVFKRQIVRHTYVVITATGNT